MRRHKEKRSSGQALIEMALILPMLVGLLFGILDVGYGAFKYVSIHQAAREALRVAEMNVPVTNGGSPIEKSEYRSMLKGVVVDSAPGVGLTSAEVFIVVDLTANTLGEVYPEATVRINHAHQFFGPFQLANQRISIGCELRCEIETWKGNEQPNFDSDS